MKTKKQNNKNRNCYFLVIYFFSIFIVAIGCSDSGTDIIETKEIPIGTLIPLSGDFENQGQQLLAAFNFAVEDINSQFEKDKKETRIKLVYEDTETKASKALEIFNSFSADNIRVCIGPITSGEVLGIKSSLDLSNSIIISPSSTLNSLAIGGDNIYRFVPNDSKMVEAVVEVMWNKGIRQAALFYVDNDWGQSFVELFKSKFEAKGGTYIGAVSYIGARNSELKEYLGELSSLIESAASTGNSKTIAVQMISLDIGAQLLELASTDSILFQVKWYGCDGFVNNDDLFNYFDEGSKFAELVEFTSPIFGSEPTEESVSLINRITEATGSTPSEYSLLAYDALVAAAKTLDMAGEDATLTELKEQLVSVCGNGNFITGNIVLNDAGDRESGSYFFWQVVSNGSSYKWEHVSTYDNGTIE